MKEIETFSRRIRVPEGHIRVFDKESLADSIGVGLSHHEVKEFVAAIISEIGISKEEFLELLEPPKFYYKLPKGLHYEYSKDYWLDASFNSPDYYDKESGGKPLTDVEFNALLKTYPSLSILEKFTEEEYEAYD